MSEVLELFRERFGRDATVLSEAPGRVNLIGEHVDYNGLPVLPVAMQRKVSIALRPRDDGWVKLHNANQRFPDIEFEISPGLEPDDDGAWSNYVKAPARELARRHAIWQGFEGVLHSDVPVAAGLSSSSAVVNAVGLALAHVNEVSVEPETFSGLMADAERFTGTEGGAMDQTISLMARSGCAAKISFRPTHVRHVPIPEDWSFVVADTGVAAEKSGAAQTVYNLRRSECEEALSQVIDDVMRTGRIRSTPAGYPGLLRSIPVDELLSLAEEILDRNLMRRFRHVVTEATRVEDAVGLLRAADIGGFGTLMDASHGSLRSDFLVSTAELDELTAIAREGGAVGARLTGAGLGGSIVALADRMSVDSVLATIASEYYEPRNLGGELDAHLFVVTPSGGAEVGPPR